jgi:hypothetical protein
MEICVVRMEVAVVAALFLVLVVAIASAAVDENGEERAASFL